MTVEVAPFAALYAITAIIAIMVAIVACDRRNVTGGKPLALVMIAVAEWALGAAAEILSVDLSVKIFWSKVCYLGAVSSPVFFLILAVQYNHLDQWLTRRNIMLVFVIPTITVLMAITNDWHGLIWNSFTPSTLVKNMIIYGHGTWFWIGVAGYSYLVTFTATLLLIWAAVRFQKTYRRQAISLAMSGLVPWASNLMYIFNLSPLPGLELTPFAFTVTGVICALAIFRFRLLDLVPVARDILVDTMRDAVLVIDEHHRIVDINPSARRLFKITTQTDIGSSAENTLPIWARMAEMVNKPKESRTEISLGETPRKTFDLSVSPIYTHRGALNGDLIVLRDITEHKHTEFELQQVNLRLRAQLAEIEQLHTILREQAFRDPLTNLYNRRHLMEIFEQELVYAHNEGYPVSVLMLDIDHFKRFNDTYGHRAADHVLCNLADMLRAQTQQSMVACRYGGDEFVVLIPRAPQAIALAMAEQIRVAFEHMVTAGDDQSLHPTLCAGVATFPMHGATPEELLNTADQALYIAKASGRNGVASA